MCTENQLAVISSAVADEAKRVLGNNLDAVVLFGSYARGDFDNESDIDIMVRINCSAEELKNHRDAFVNIASKLSLSNNIEVSITLVDLPSFNKYRKFLPFYMNVDKEGVNIA